MIRTVSYLAILALASPAFAQDTPAAGSAPDMSKAGPWTRPVKNPDKKGVDQLFKAMQDAWMKGDVDAVAEYVDFPVVMQTDDSKGEAHQMLATRDQWVSMMKSMSMPKEPKPKLSHKHQVTFLSETLAVAIEDTSMSAPKKAKWKSMSVLTKKDGAWKIKEMAQAGWGDMAPAQTAAEKAHQPTNTLPPAPPR